MEGNKLVKVFVSVTTETVHVKAVYMTYAIKYSVGSCSQNSMHDKCCVPTVMNHNKCYSMGC